MEPRFNPFVDVKAACLVASMARISEILNYVHKVFPESSRLYRHITSIEKLSEYLKYIHLLDGVKKSARVIDWGAQFGHITILLQENGYSDVIPFCIDQDFPAVKSALSRFFPDKFVLGSDSLLLPFKDCSVDVFISSGVFEHIQEFGVCPSAMMEEIYRVLRPGGSFILWKLPNVSGMSELKSDLLNLPSHEFRYTSKGFSRIAKSCGFEISLCGSEGILPLKVATSMRSLPVLRRVEGLIVWLSCRKPLNLFANDHYFVLRRPG